MKIYCLKNEFISEAAEYTISYLLNHGGFFFEWITEPKKGETDGLLLVYQSENSPFDLAVPAIRLSQHLELNKLIESHFKWKEISIGSDIIPILTHPENQNLSESNPRIDSFDLVANVYYHLARLEESGYEHPEDIDKNVENCILFKHGKYLNPVVDILSNLLSKEIEKKAKEKDIFFIKKAFYPQGQTFAISLTHDVDFIRAFHPLKKRIIKLFIRLGLKKNISNEEIDQQEQDTWGFDRLLSFYKKNSYQVTFFFMAKYLEGLHFRYWVGSKKIRQLLEQIKSENHEIAFHPSRYAFESPNRYLKEKSTLERISGTPIAGLRHHYLRCLFPQIWRTTAELNLEYEAGMVHRYHSGFRAGTCFPYPAFDDPNQKRIDIIEFPTTFFENTLPDKGSNFEASKETIQRLLSIVKNQGGLLNILWHSNNIYQPDIYRKLWDFITGLIRDEDAYLKTLTEHSNWYNFRGQIQLHSIKKSNFSYVIDIALPEVVHQFCLHVPANYTYKSESELQHDSIKNTLIINMEKLQTQVIIEAQAI